MSQNKKNEFPIREKTVAEFARLLSHPARLSILLTLAEKKSCVCGEIVEVLPLAQATVSQHLKELKEAGLIQGELEGKSSCYCINWEMFQKSKESLEDFLEIILESKGPEECC